jgi:prevent-host-death family protein
MAEVTIVDAREHFSDVINRTAYAKERIILTRRGKNIVAIVPLEDLILLEAFEDKLDIQDAKLALKEAKKKGTMSLKEFKEKIEKD